AWPNVLGLEQLPDDPTRSKPITRMERRDVAKAHDVFLPALEYIGGGVVPPSHDVFMAPDAPLFVRDVRGGGALVAPVALQPLREHKATFGVAEPCVEHVPRSLHGVP